MKSPEELLRRVFPPMLATLADGPPHDSAQWTYELKYDGFRAVSALLGGELAMWSRNELDLAERFPKSAAAMAKVKCKEVVLDGEIVVFDEKGAPRFQLLQQGDNREIVVLFDVLWLDGADLRRKTYEERHAILEKILKRAPDGVQLAQKLEMSGEKALEHAAKNGWEGIIAKKRTSCYEGRRSKEWLKVKALNQQEFAIVGWQPSTHSASEIGSLHLGVLRDDGKLHYAGKVGTGFSAKMRVWLRDELAKDVVPAPMVEGAPRIRDATWVRPRLVAQVAFTEWTHDDRLRHPSFLGLREDKSVREVVKEEPLKQRAGNPLWGPALSRPGGLRARRHREDGLAGKSHVTLTNPDRLLYPRDGYTKTDLANYYEAMQGPLLRALRDRPLSLEHWNQGIDKPSWFHQNLGREAPEWLTTIDTPTRASSSKTVKHLVVDSVDALRWLAQMSVLTIHMWASHAPALEEPDWLVFDLDPAKGKGIEQAIEAAIIMRRLLENLELPSIPKTSGKRGIHVFLPLAAGYTHEEAADFACNLAAGVAQHVPGVTVERSLAKRRGRLYLDCMQNAYGKTIVAPYSPRGIDGAPVSAPLKWSEVTKKLDPLKYNIKTMPKRLDKVGDLFAEVFEKRATLPELK